MIRFKYPLEYELIPDILEKSTQWLTLRLKNVGDDSLHNLEIKMHSTDTLQISFNSSSGYIHRLTPHEEQHLNFQVDVHGTTALYISIRYFKEGGSFHWDSPWIREEVLGEVAELEGILVSNSYGAIGRELEAEATIKSLGNSDGLDLRFWADTPSGKYEELAEIKTKNLSRATPRNLWCGDEEARKVVEQLNHDAGYEPVYTGPLRRRIYSNNNYKKENFEDILHDYDGVFDTVGGDTYKRSFEVLKKGSGIITSMLEQPNSELMNRYGVKALVQFTQANRQLLTKLAEWVDQNNIKVNIDKTFSIDEAANALDYQKDVHPRGKVVITV